MALSFDIDIYNWLLVDILKVNPTGDPVNDAVYLVLLPMVVLYMFVTDITMKSRFAVEKIKYIIMFIMGFFIVREGYYPIFAAFSLPLLIFLMIWYSIGFLRGDNKSIKGINGTGTYNYQRSSGEEGGSNKIGYLDLLFKPVSRAIRSVDPRELEDTRERLRRLNVAWMAEEKLNGNPRAQILMQKNEMRDILEKAVDVLKDFDNDARNTLIKELHPKFKECLEDAYRT